MQTSDNLIVTMNATWIATIDYVTRWLLVRAHPYQAYRDPIEVRYTLSFWMCGLLSDDADHRNEPQQLIARISDHDAYSIIKAATDGFQTIYAGALAMEAGATTFVPGPATFGPVGWTSLRSGEGIAVTVQKVLDAKLVLAFGDGDAARLVSFDANGLECLFQALTIASRAFGEDLSSSIQK